MSEKTAELVDTEVKRILDESYEAARVVLTEHTDLLERIAEDDAFGLDRDDLAGIVDASRFIGRAPEQVARFLDRHVTPTLERQGRHTRDIDDPDIHV